MKEKFYAVLKKRLKERKATSLDEILPKVWRARKFTTYFFNYVTLSISKNNREIDKSLYLLRPKEGGLGITKKLPMHNSYCNDFYAL